MQRRIMHTGLLVNLFATMAYPLTKLSGHEWIAYLFALIVGYHVYEHRRALGTFARRGTPRIRFLRAANYVLCAVFVICFLSGFLFSSLIPHPGREVLRYAKYVHICSSSWFYALVAMHAGFYWDSLRHTMRRVLPPLGGKWHAVLGAISLYGLYIAVARNFFLKMAYLYLKHPKAEPSAILFFVDYFAIFILFAYFGWWLLHFISRRRATHS